MGDLELYERRLADALVSEYSLDSVGETIGKRFVYSKLPSICLVVE